MTDGLDSLLEKIAQVSPWQQLTQWSCSAACLRAVLLHYGTDVPEAECVDAIGTIPHKGAEVDQIAEGARKLGFDAFDYCFDSLDQAKALLDADIPIICDIQSFHHEGKGHYVVLMKIEGDSVFIMDPNTAGNQRVLTRDHMDARWWDHTMAVPHDLKVKWGVVAIPREEPAVKIAGEKCCRCKKPATVKVLWAEAMGYQPACEEHKEVVADVFRNKTYDGKPYDDFSGFRKIAFVRTELQPQQQRVVDRIQQPDQPGLVVAHGLGSGKTLTSIAAQNALKMPSTVVVPAALRANYKKERKLHLGGKNPKANIVSMQNMAAKDQPPKDPMMIVDEAHRMRDPSSKTFKTLEQNEAQKRLLLTGSPFYNHPADIAPLVDVAAGSDVLPKRREEFAQRYMYPKRVEPGFVDKYIRGMKPGVVETLNPRRKQELQEILNKWVDYHPSSKQDFPEVTRENVKVPMTHEQLKVYDTMLKKAPPWVAAKVRSGLPPSKQESKQLNAFLSATRQVSNTTAPFQVEGDAHDPKIDTAFKNLQEHLGGNERRKALIYSNYLAGGIDPYKQRLDEAKVPYGAYTGQMDRESRDELVKQYNANKLKALLVSSAGGEGLDLKGTSLIQMLDPHWNDEKLKQVEGRGIRYKSHSDLPEDERKVLVQRYLATRPRSGVLENLRLRSAGGSVDEYLAQLSADKEKVINDFRQLLEQKQQQAVR